MWQRLKKRIKGITKSETKRAEPDTSVPNELSLSGMRKRYVSPLDSPVWRFSLLISAGCLAGWLIHILFSFYHPIAIWIAALLTGASWVVAIRMLLLESRLKKFWIVWISGGFLFMFIFSSSGAMWIVSSSFSFVFLLFRRYRPYRHLTARHRAGLFLLGFIVFILLTSGWFAGKEVAQTASQEPGGPAVFSLNLAKYFLLSLQMFWFFTLFRLFFAIRLHFLKLRSKLAVSTFLIAVLPLFLVIVIGLVSLYSTLGESRATRARTILYDWANLAVLDENLIHAISDRSFSYRIDGKKIQTEAEKPPWLPEFLSSLNKKGSRYAEWASSESANYFWIGPDLWLISLSGDGKTNASIKGCQVDNTMMNRLAKILNCDVRLSLSTTLIFSDEGDVSIEADKRDHQPPMKDIYGKFLPEDSKQQESGQASTSLWRRSLYFGMTHVEVISFDSGQFKSQDILLLIEGSLSSIVRELFSERNPLSVVVMVALLTLAVLMFILEAFALFFGVRITTGITSAVKALHRGTRRIAAGDLDTQIVIPNEDELGDLATSFNVMSAAVKKGREEAIARERLERELETARQIQEKLLPHEMPQVPGFEIAGTSVPSQQVGGDYFDFIDMETGQLGVAIADVSGKGIPAALLMANLQASLHAQVLKPGTVADVAFRMNNLLVRSTDTHMFATFFYGILDRKKSTFTSTSAGHNPPLLFRSDGKIERLEAGGLILGFLPDQKYIQKTLKIKPGEVLVLYTDGITEAVGASSKKIAESLFGEERLIEVVRAHLTKSAGEIQASILKAISAHTGDTPQYDDITLVVIKRKEN